jgi:hypothetical protein
MLKLIQTPDGKRREGVSGLQVRPTFESAIETPLQTLKLKPLKALENFNSPAIQALRLYHSEIETHEELDLKRRELEALMREVAAEYKTSVRSVAESVHSAASAGMFDTPPRTPTGDTDEEDEEDDGGGGGDDGGGGGGLLLRPAGLPGTFLFGAFLPVPRGCGRTLGCL